MMLHQAAQLSSKMLNFAHLLHNLNVLEILSVESIYSVMDDVILCTACKAH